MMKSRWIPDRKVLAGGLSACATWLLLEVIEYLGVPVSSDVAGMLVTLASSLAGYLTPPSVKDIAKRLDRDLRSAFLDRSAP